MTARPIRWSLVVGILVAVCGCSTTERPATESIAQVNVGRVNDEAGVFTVSEKEHIAKLLENYERETFHQIGVVTVKTLAGESIETYSLRVANNSRLGLKGIDNGILIVVAPSDRKARIEIGRGFEKYISDSRAQEIMNTQMLPAFRQQQYADGVERGLTLLMSDGRTFVIHR